MDSENREDIWSFFEKKLKDKPLIDAIKERISTVDLQRWLLMQHPVFGLNEEEYAAVIAYKDRYCAKIPPIPDKGLTAQEKEKATNEREMKKQEVHDDLCGIGKEFDDYINDAKKAQPLIQDNPFSGLSEIELKRILLHRNKTCRETKPEEIDGIVCGQGY